MAKNNEIVTFCSLSGPAQTLQAMIPNLPMLQQGGWQSGTTQAGSSLSETGSTISRGRGGTRGGTRAQHAKAGQLGGIATAKRLGRPRKTANIETSGATS